jgi:hypothetical protein
MFTKQTDWILANRTNRNIVFVAQLGDCTENGDKIESEWLNATNALYRLEDAAKTSLPFGLPYGVAVGNHDQSPNGHANGTTRLFNKYFGAEHFTGKRYYGGHFDTNNNNHYELFTASGMDFIVIFIEYDTTMTADSTVLKWANDLLRAHPERRGIIVSHWLINAGFNASFSAQGKGIYEALKANPNLTLMLCGHMTPPEGQRHDTFEGRTVWTVLSDYQYQPNGGNGWLRIYTFSPANNVIHVQTFSPVLNEFDTKASSQFDIPYPMTPANAVTGGK